MRYLFKTRQRRGSILPLLVVSIVSLTAFVALAVDIGMMVVTRTQCQNAADTAAMSGARTLNGDTSSNNNYAAASAMAYTAAESNKVLNQAIQDGQVSVQIGSYSYDSTNQKFYSAIPRTAGDNNSLVTATVSYTGNTAFAKILGISSFSVSATSTAAHRPRDVAMVLDYSGSMRFSSLMGLPVFGARTGSNNPESVFPQFGHYSNTAAAGLQNTSPTTDGSGNRFNPANVTEADAANSYSPPVVNDFYSTTSPAVPAFSPAPSSYATLPAGDDSPSKNFDAGPGYATNVKDFVSSTNKNSTFESGGYDAYKIDNRVFSGYSQGPSYWGKTFWNWPPDPRSAKDWRQLYFIDAVSGGRVTRNTRLYDSSGRWLAPSSATYKIDYRAIFSWLTRSPNPFPSQMQAGRILYYSAMPNSADVNLNTRFWTQFPLTDTNERFWKEYIDYVLGLRQKNDGTWSVITRYTGYGDDFTWGTAGVNIAFDPATDAQNRYMDYSDNPLRPKLHFWFGPMTMVDFLGNYNLWYFDSPYCTDYNWWPGTAHEAPLYACKLGIQAALADVQSNHPNDNLAMIMFSVPLQSASTSGGGRFNRARNPLNRNYSRMTDCLWFPLTTIDNPGTTLNPYDFATNLQVPRAMGGTAYSMGFMLAYNQFSSNSSLKTFNSGGPAGDAGGLGRKGAQRLIILETDGAPNTTATAGFSNAGAYNSYYNVRYAGTGSGSSEYPSCSGYSDNDPTVTSEIFSIVGQICALDTATPPGYSTTRKPVLVHCIGFGPIFEAASASRTAALATLQQIQYIGKTQSSPGAALPSYKIIIGDDPTKTALLRSAINAIMEDGVQVVLIK